MPVDPETPSFSNDVTRRKFIAVAACTAGAMFIKPSLVHGSEANSAVRVGLLGCGGRGTEDATNLVDTGGARVLLLAICSRISWTSPASISTRCNREKAMQRWMLPSSL